MRCSNFNDYLYVHYGIGRLHSITVEISKYESRDSMIEPKSCFTQPSEFRCSKRFVVRSVPYRVLHLAYKARQRDNYPIFNSSFLIIIQSNLLRFYKYCGFTS